MLGIYGGRGGLATKMIQLGSSLAAMAYGINYSSGTADFSTLRFALAGTQYYKGAFKKGCGRG